MAPRTPFIKAITVLMGSANGIQGARHAKYANSNIQKLIKCKLNQFISTMEDSKIYRDMTK